jgi:hypothetical protein
VVKKKSRPIMSSDGGGGGGGGGGRTTLSEVSSIMASSEAAVSVSSPSWPARSDGTHALPAYREALSKICIRPDIMCTSPLTDKLSLLAKQYSAECTTDEASWRSIATRTIKNAFGLATDSAAASYSGTTLVMDGNGNPIHCCLYNAMQQFYQEMQWERRYLLWALYRANVEFAAGREDADSLNIAIGLMVRGALECSARKRMAFSTIINRCSIGTPASVSVAPAIAAEENSSENAINAARTRLLQASITYIDDLKTRAVRSTFYEPVEFYSHCLNVDNVMMDIDVHGVSSFLCVLQATTGILTSRLPDYSDGYCIGVVNIFNADMQPMLDLLWEPSNIGKSWRSLPQHRDAAYRPKRRVPANQFFTNANGSTVHIAGKVMRT